MKCCMRRLDYQVRFYGGGSGEDGELRGQMNRAIYVQIKLTVTGIDAMILTDGMHTYSYSKDAVVLLMFNSGDLELYPNP